MQVDARRNPLEQSVVQFVTDIIFEVRWSPAGAAGFFVILCSPILASQTRSIAAGVAPLCKTLKKQESNSSGGSTSEVLAVNRVILVKMENRRKRNRF